MSKHTDRLADLEDLYQRYANLAVDWSGDPTRRFEHSQPKQIAAAEIYQDVHAARELLAELIDHERSIGRALDVFR